MSASSSESLNSEYHEEELRDTGLMTGETTRKSPPKEVAKPKRKPRPPIRSRGRHAAKRNPLNLDSIDLPKPPAEESTLFGVAHNVAGIERRVSNHLTQSLRNAIDEFALSLTHLLSEPSEIWRNVSEFVESLKQAVRDELTGLVAGEHFEINRIVSGFESSSLRFRSIFETIEAGKSVASSQEVKGIKSASLAVSSYLDLIRTGFSFTEISEELNELNQIRLDSRATRMSSQKRARQSFLSLLDLEAEGRRQKLESELVRQRLNHIDEHRRRFDDSGLELDSDSGNDDLRAKLRDLTEEMVRRTVDSPLQGQVGRHTTTFDSVRSNLQSVRRMQDIQIAALQERLRSVRIVGAPAPRDEVRAKSKPVKPEGRLGLLSDLQERLRALQEKHESALKDTSKFLSAVRKKERQRKIRQMSKLIGGDTEFKSLFSFM